MAVNLSFAGNDEDFISARIKKERNAAAAHLHQQQQDRLASATMMILTQQVRMYNRLKHCKNPTSCCLILYV